MKTISALVLAAGAGERFGGGKLLQNLPNGKTIIQHVVDVVKQQKFAQIVVVVGYEADLVRKSIDDPLVDIVLNPNWRDGASTSLKSGVNALKPTCDACMIFLGDQPLISKDLMQALCSAYLLTNMPIVYPVIKGVHANPVLLDRSIFSAINTLKGDVGARALFNRFSVQEVNWDDEQAFWDVDTPGDLSRIRSAVVAPEE